jgi:hypothetical protein
MKWWLGQCLEKNLQLLPWCGACAVEGGKGGRPREEGPGQEEKNFTKFFSLLFEQDTPGFSLRCFGETEPPIFVPLHIRPVRSIT